MNHPHEVEKTIVSDYSKEMAKYICSQLDVETAHPANRGELGKEIYQEILTTDNDSLEVYLATKIEDFIENGDYTSSKLVECENARQEFLKNLNQTV